MGACSFECLGYGRTPEEAFKSVTEEARYMYGHSGYTGTVGEKSSFVSFTLPPRVKARDLINWVADADYLLDERFLRDELAYAQEWAAKAPPGKVRETRRRVKDVERNIKAADKERAVFNKKCGKHLGLVREMAPYYSDKWGPAICIELTGAQKKAQSRQLRRGERVFVFCGIASL